MIQYITQFGGSPHLSIPRCMLWIWCEEISQELLLWNGRYYNGKYVLGQNMHVNPFAHSLQKVNSTPKEQMLFCSFGFSYWKNILISWVEIMVCQRLPNEYFREPCRELETSWFIAHSNLTWHSGFKLGVVEDHFTVGSNENKRTLKGHKHILAMSYLFLQTTSHSGPAQDILQLPHMYSQDTDPLLPPAPSLVPHLQTGSVSPS